MKPDIEWRHFLDVAGPIDYSVFRLPFGWSPAMYFPDVIEPTTNGDNMYKFMKLSLNDEIPKNTTQLTLLVELNSNILKIDYRKKDCSFLELDDYEYVLRPSLNPDKKSGRDTQIQAFRIHIDKGVCLSEIINKIHNNHILGVEFNFRFLYARAKVEFDLETKFEELCERELDEKDVPDILKDILPEIYLAFNGYYVHYPEQSILERLTKLYAKICILLPIAQQRKFKEILVQNYSEMLEKALLDKE